MKKNAKKIIIIAIILAALAAFKFFNLGEYLSLSYIKESHQKFEALYAEHTMPVIGGYMLIYIIVTSLSLPGAAV
ncbi:MAG: TVP38/TMEM64 family protein, partial [Nitrospirota bacterium]|nr:TVP38/TMEM64 family protein [Nitrospirota bacterium]